LSVRITRIVGNAKLEAANCQHNYVEKEEHYGEEVMVTHKGAVSAKLGQYGIISDSRGWFTAQCISEHIRTQSKMIKSASKSQKMV
jgi:RNA-splicing ligase RtcB